MKKIFSTIVMAFAVLTASAYDLTVGTSENGTLSFKVGGETVTTADAGKTVTVVIAPNDGYVTTAVTATAYTSWGSARAKSLNPSLVDAITVTGSANEWTFTMPEANVEVSAEYIIHIPTPAEETEAGDKEVKNVAVIMEVVEGQTPVTDPKTGITTVPVVLTGVDIPAQTDATAANPKAISVEIQASTQVGKTVFVVNSVAAGAFKSKEPTAVVNQVVMPETEAALPVAEGAMKPNDEPLEVIAPLALLDDYALMTSLKENFEAAKLKAEVKTPNLFWTVSSGVDLVLPDGLTAYIVYLDGSAIRYAEIPEEELVLAGGRRGIKANNGVLIGGQKGVTYDFVASPGNQKSGTVPATTDAKSYAGNCLEPVIESKNYAAGSYVVLKNNEFHSIKVNSSKVKACKAVLRIK